MDIFEVPEDLGLFHSQLHERHLELLHTYECLLPGCQRCQEMEPVARHIEACRDGRPPGACYRVKAISEDEDYICQKQPSCFQSYSECSFPSNCWILRAKMKVWSDCTDEHCPVCSDVKGWRLSMTTERRKLIIGLLKGNGDKVPKDDPSFGTERKYTWTQYERAVYNEAESVTDYFRHLATKKWDMEMDNMSYRRNKKLFSSRRRV